MYGFSGYNSKGDEHCSVNKRKRYRLTNKTKGIVLIITAAFAFALMNTFVKLSGDLPSIQKAFFRNIITWLFSFVILLKNRQGIHVQKGNWPWMILRCVCGILGVLCNFYAVDHLLLAETSLLSKLAPFFAVLISWLILKEKPKAVQALCVLGALLGSYFLLNPSLLEMSINIPSLVAVFGALCAGIAYTVVRKLGARGQDGTTIIFMFSSFSCVAILPVLLLDYHPMSGAQLGFLLLAGLAATLGQFAVTNAYILAPARHISVYDYTQVLFAGLLGFMLYGEVPTLQSLPGYLLIVSMGVFAFLYDKHLAKVSFRKMDHNK